MPLISKADFDDLPSEPIERWLSLRDLVEQRFESRQDFNSGPDLNVCLEYVEILKAAAEELGVGSIEDISPANVREEFDIFRANIAALATKLSLRKATSVSSKQVALSASVAERLRHDTYKLREFVTSANMVDRKKRILQSLLDEFLYELERDTLDYSRAMRVLALCAAAIGGTTAFLANAPEAANTIVSMTQLIGLQAEANEEAENRLKLPQEPAVPRLPPPPKQIPPPADQT